MYLRSLTSEFRNQLKSFLKQSWFETYGPELGQEKARLLVNTLQGDNLGGLLPGDDEAAFLAFDDGHNIVGSIIRAERGNHVYICVEELYVASAQQRRGIGCQLLLAALDGIEPDQIVELAVLVASVGAQKFYQNAGFRSVGFEASLINESVTVPAIVMQAPVGTVHSRLRSCFGRDSGAKTGPGQTENLLGQSTIETTRAPPRDRIINQ